MKSHILTQGVVKPESEWARPGKVEWPDIVTVKIPKRDALRFLTAIALQLDNRDLLDDSDNGSVELTFTGKLLEGE